MGLALVAALSLSSTLMAWAWGALTPSFGVNLAVYLLQARTEQAELSRPTLTDPLRQFQWAFPVVCVWCISINVLIGIFMAGFPATLPACSLVLAAFSLLLGVRVAVHLCMADSHLARGVFSWSWMSTVVAAVSAYAAADRHAGAGSDPLVTNVSEWAMLCWTFMYFLGGCGSHSRPNLPRASPSARPPRVTQADAPLRCAAQVARADHRHRAEAQARRHLRDHSAVGVTKGSRLRLWLALGVDDGDGRADSGGPARPAASLHARRVVRARARRLTAAILLSRCRSLSRLIHACLLT